tara:strand:- start:997 stop:1233 length:237 start_codon:yes stop_codon:yes gene_type:complete
MKTYPDEILSLLTDKGFDASFEKHTNSFSTYQDAYEAVEAVVYHWFKIRRYASYDSYRKRRASRLKSGSSHLSKNKRI